MFIHLFRATLAEQLAPLYSQRQVARGLLGALPRQRCCCRWWGWRVPDFVCVVSAWCQVSLDSVKVRSAWCQVSLDLEKYSSAWYQVSLDFEKDVSAWYQVSSQTICYSLAFIAVLPPVQLAQYQA